VIRRELLIDAGDPYDSLLVAESERNLRALGIFRDVEIDRVETDSGIVLLVRTA
jgi:outer membrane protein assembly factor BamA